jgi:hypothetical protein
MLCESMICIGTSLLVDSISNFDVNFNITKVYLNADLIYFDLFVQRCHALDFVQ